MQSRLSKAMIQVNVPDEPYPGTRTKVITFNVQEDRDLLVELYTTTERVGMCDPAAIERGGLATEVMSVSFSGDALDPNDARTFHVFKNKKGDWITTGVGACEVVDMPGGFVEYRCSRSALRKAKQWYEKHVPLENRKR